MEIYSSALENEELRNNMFHALERITYHAAHGEDTDNCRLGLEQVRKHVDLLDGLALFLTFRRSGGEVTATGLTQRPGKTTIFWAKNTATEATEQQTKYIKELIRKFQEQEEVPIILEYIISACKDKISGRIKKLAVLFKEGQEFPPESQNNLLNLPKNETIRRIEVNLQNRGWLARGTDIFKATDSFLRRLLTMNVFSTVGQMDWIITFAFALTIMSPKIEDMISTVVWRRLCKLADYRECCIHTLANVGAIKGNEIIPVQASL